MKGLKDGRHGYVKLTVNQRYLIDFLMLDLDVETATIICIYYGEGLGYKEIAERLYNECQSQITGGAKSRISGRLKRGQERILAAEPSEADLENYPEIAKKAISSILSRYAPTNDKDPKNGRPEVNTAEKTTSKDDNGPSPHAEEIQEERTVTITVTPSVPPKSCPRCTGSLLFEEDMHGAYSTCINCGYVYEFGATAAAELENEGEPRQRRRQPMHGQLKL